MNMGIDTSKTVIRIVQDYCFNNSAPILSNEFSLFVSSSISDAIEHKSLSVSEFTKKVAKRKDFFQANDLNVRSFCKGLFEKLNYEFSFLSDMSFAAAINEFKRKMENGVFKGFPKDKIDEDTVEHLYYLFGKKLFANHALVPAIMISLFLPKKLLLKQNCGKVKNTTNLEYQNYTAIL